MSEPRRYAELDSLRGLAALTVVLHHYLLANSALSDQAVGVMHILIQSPVHVFWSGPEAVSLFYVLSGFVLALPFLNRPKPYVFFAAQRTARIYGPYIFAVGFGLLARHLLYNGNMPGLSAWANDVWSPASVSTRNLVGHALLLPNFESFRIVPVFWSLVQEMRASLVFPLLLLLCFRTKASTALAFAFVTFCFGTATTYLTAKHWHIEQDYTVFFQVVPLFILGILLAIHREKAVAWVSGLGSGKRVGLFVLAVLVYTYRWWVPIPRLSFFFLMLTGLAGAAFILLALGSPHAGKVLLWRPIHAVGRASYSLYLIHGIILISCLHAFYSGMGYIGACAIGAVLTIPATWAFWRLIEVPMTNLSHRWGRVDGDPPSERSVLIRGIPIALWIAVSVICAVIFH